MASNPTPSRVRENNVYSENPDKVEHKETHDSKEIKEASVGKEAYTEALGFDESAETTGKVSEILSKQASEQGGAGGTGKTSRTVYDPAQIKDNLLKNLPSERAMKRQIEREIKKEIVYLHRRAIRMLHSPGSMNCFEMSNLMKKIRELKGILLTLIKLSIDGLKTFWLRFVHGIM